MKTRFNIGDTVYYQSDEGPRSAVVEWVFCKVGVLNTTYNTIYTLKGVARKYNDREVYRSMESLEKTKGVSVHRLSNSLANPITEEFI